MTTQTLSWPAVWTLAQDSAAATTAAPAAAASEPLPVGVPQTAGGTAQPAGTGPAAPRPGGGMEFMWIMFAVLLAMIIMTTLAGRKEKKKRAELMSSLKKQDKVMMTGGVIGTVVELSDDEVVVRIEEGKIRYARSAVQSIMQKSADSAKPALSGAA